MKRPKRKLRLAGVAAVAALALAAAGCGSGAGSGNASSGKTVKGGTATFALQPGTTLSWIFPFYSITNSSVYNSEQFQWLMYRPLYMFGNNTANDVAINYPLSPANAPVYTNGGKTVSVTMKGWKWSDGSSVDAKSLMFYMNMVEAEKANWYATTPGLLPDNVASYQATSADTVTFQLKQAYSSIWFTYNQLAELTPMPAAWDVTSLTAKAGSGGCITDTAADNWAKCKAVYTFLTAQSKISGTYASSPLWAVADGPWKLSAYSAAGNVTMVPNKAYSGSPKPQLAAIKFLPYTDDTTEYTALKTGQVDVGYIPKEDLPTKPAGATLPGTNPLGSAYNLQAFYSFGIYYGQPNFNNPAVGPMVRQLYMRQALQEVFDQPGIDKAIFRGYAVPDSGPAPNTPPGNQWTPAIQKENNGQGPYPFDIAKATALLTSHGWSEVGGVMTCQDPSKCGTGITKGQQAKFTYVYSTGQASVTAQWQAYKSDASKAGIDINLVGQTFNTIIGESAPCAPMGPKCNIQVFAFGGWNFNGPGFEPTGEPLFATGAGSNSGNYSDPQMDKLITATHTSSNMSAFNQYATYGAQQLPFVWAPNPYAIQAVSSKLKNVTFNAQYTLLPEYWSLTK
ncbi:MAG: ABC transporter substrate-binding protein [Actinomycetota bacterium]|nr:ABC transporter substrate-binding protein [Actinomycetota bacterium]